MQLVPQESQGSWELMGMVVLKMIQELWTELRVGYRWGPVIVPAEAVLLKQNCEIGWYRVSVALVPSG